MTGLLPEGVKVFQFRGPLFFGAAGRVREALQHFSEWPRVLTLRMRDVPLIDATAVSALDELAALAGSKGCRLIVSGLQRQPRQVLHSFGFLRENRILVA